MTNNFVEFGEPTANDNQLKIKRQLYFTANSKQGMKIYLSPRDVKHEFSYISEVIT